MKQNSFFFFIFFFFFNLLLANIIISYNKIVNGKIQNVSLKDLMNYIPSMPRYSYSWSKKITGTLQENLGKRILLNSKMLLNHIGLMLVNFPRN